MEEFFLFIVWIGFCIGSGYLATTKGRNGVLWFFIAFLASPLLACILLLILPPETGERRPMSRFERRRRERQEQQEGEEERAERKRLEMERKREEDERRMERQQQQMLNAALLSRLAPPQQAIQSPQLAAPAVQPPPLPGEEEPPPLPDEIPMTGWHVEMNGKKVGPLDVNRLAQLLAHGHIGTASLVWRKGYPGWTALKSEKALLEMLNRLASPPVAEATPQGGTIVITCPSCGTTANAKPALVGKMVRCRACSTGFLCQD